MDAIAQITLFGNLFTVCIVVAILGFVLGVFFFFFFDIPKVYALMTGKGKEASIRQTMEGHAKTGHIRKSTGLTGQMGANTSKVKMIINLEEVAQPVEAPIEETSVLTAEEDGVTTMLSSVETPEIQFLITENTLVIHTDELI